MYYSSAEYKVTVFKTVKSDGKDYGTTDMWKITVYCKARSLQDGGIVADYDNIAQLIHTTFASGKMLVDIVGEDASEENVAKWLYEQIIPCYKIKIVTSKNNVYIYEEDNI